MAWEWRRGQRYYYRSVRVDDSVRKQYFGYSPEAIAAANQDVAKQAAKKKHAEREQQFAKDLTKFDALIARYERACDLIVRAALLCGGYHRRRSEWRRRRGMDAIFKDFTPFLGLGQTPHGIDLAPQTPPLPDLQAEYGQHAVEDDLESEEPTEFDGYDPELAARRPGHYQETQSDEEIFEQAVATVAERLKSVPEAMRELTARAELGDEEARRQVAESFEAHPEMWAELSDAGRTIEHLIASQLAAGTEWRTEAIKARAKKQREAYRGSNASPIVELMADRVVAIWLQLQLAELKVTTDDTAVASSKHVKVLATHDRRLSRAIKDLDVAHRAAGTAPDAAALRDATEGSLESAEASEPPTDDVSLTEKSSHAA